MVKKLLFLIFLFSFFKIGFSQGTAGRDFWVTFLEPDWNCFPPEPPRPDSTAWWEDDTLELYLLSPHAAKVTIETKINVPIGSGLDTNFTGTYILKPNKVLYVKIPSWVASHAFFSDAIINNGVHVFSDTLINVYAVNRYNTSKGATSVLPVASIPLSPEYFVTTNESSDRWSCFPGNTKDAKSSQFAIVGISAMSDIEIIPTGISTIRNNRRGIPFVIHLRQGETFGYVSSDDDLSGSIIRSRDANSKFAVFAGNRRTYSYQLNNSKVLCKSALDHTYEQLFPTVTLGNSYTALPFKNSPGGYYLKVVAIEDFTRVDINGTYFKTLKQGEFFIWNVSADSATRIKGDKHISVTQFNLGNGCNQHPAPKKNFGGIAQLQLIPDQQAVTKADVSRLIKEYYGSWTSVNAPENCMNVLVKTSDTSQLRINGKAVSNIFWKRNNSNIGYSYAQLDMDSINYHITCNKGFIAYVYGHGLNDGYTFAAAANFKPIHNNFYSEGQCTFDTTTFCAIKNDSFSNYSWNTGNNKPHINGSKIKILYKDTGWYRVVMYCRHKRTNQLDSVCKNLYINVARSRQAMLIKDTIICGKVEFIVYSKNYHEDNIYLWNDGHPFHYHAIKIPGQFWQKVTERNGCSYIDTLNVIQYQNPVAAFSKSDSLFCANKIKDITFTNLSTSVDTIVYNEWDFGDLNVLDSHKILKHRYKKADLYMVLLKIKTNKGCTDNTFQLVKILKAPKADFIMNATDTCFRSNKVNYNNITVIDSASHQRYKWHFSDSFVISNSNPAGPRAFKIQGKNYAELIYENFNGCIDTMKKSISIYSHPKSAFIFGNTFQCVKDSIRFINMTTSDYKPIKSDWGFGDNTTSTLFSPKHFYGKKGIYNVRLISGSPQGCKDTLSLPLKVLGSPNANFSVSNTIQCLSGNRFRFINTSTADTGNFPLRKWTYSDGTGDQDTDTTFKSFNVVGKHTIKLKVTGILGCSDSLTRSVEVKGAPVAQFTANRSSQCFLTQNFSFNYIPRAGNDSIKGIAWYFNGDSIKNKNTISNIKFPFAGKYPVKLKLYSKYGCDGEVIRSVFVNPDPISQFKVPKPLQCLNGNAFTAVHYSSVVPGKITGFSWDFGDLTNSVMENPVPKTYNKSGYYKIVLTVFSDSGCTDTSSFHVMIRPNAIIKIDTVKEVCLNDSATLNGSATLGGGFISSYQWDFGDNSITDTVLNPGIKHIYKTPGVYSIQLTTISNFRCKDIQTAGNWVRVNALPNPAFRYEIKDGGQNNSIVSFSDLTQPKPVSLRWDFGIYGRSKKPDTAISIFDTTTIKARLYITDSKGCMGMLEKNIFASAPGRMFFPNAFTANNDGVNDGFGPQGVLFATNYKFTIFNRWGEIVFKSEELGETWDGNYQGKLCPNGNYIYKLELNDFFGHYKKYEGNILLIW